MQPLYGNYMLLLGGCWSLLCSKLIVLPQYRKSVPFVHMLGCFQLQGQWNRLWTLEELVATQLLLWRSWESIIVGPYVYSMRCRLVDLAMHFQTFRFVPVYTSPSWPLPVHEKDWYKVVSTIYAVEKGFFPDNTTKEKFVKKWSAAIIKYHEM